MSRGVLVLALSAVCICLTQSPAAARAAEAVTGTQQIPARAACLTSEKRPDLSALPVGTRVYFDPVLAIGYPKPGVTAAEVVYSGAHHGDVRADVRDNAIYVNGQKSPATIGGSKPVTFRARIQVCTYLPGEELPPILTGVTPDLILR